MMTKMTQFINILAANGAGFTANLKGDRKGNISRGGQTPIEVVYKVMTGTTPESVNQAACGLFQSERLRRLAVAGASAPSLLYIYRRAFAAVWKSSGKVMAIRYAQDEWDAIVSVRGQMLKALDLKDPLTGSDRLPRSLITKDTPEEAA